MYFCELGSLTVVGSSPEALVRLNGRDASLRPIAGTRPRGRDAADDAAPERELRADPKENAEHVMLVDLARNDLGRVAQAGTVHVDPYRSIERYSHVMHIVSGVNGSLADGRDAFDLFAATFPAGTLVGAPKVRAMQIIDELEPVRRGLYGGTVGYFGVRGDMDQAITIRTLVFEGDRYSYQAGAGIVADSVPAAEYAEVLAKSAALRRALELREGGAVKPRLLLIDNYDSFTYNLVQAFLVLGADVRVHRNDAISVEEARALEPTHLAISPGPGHTGRCGHIHAHDRGVRRPSYRSSGVCLGHQSLVAVFGGRSRARRAPHARQDLPRTARRPHDLRGADAAVRGRALPLAHRRNLTAARHSSR